MSDNTKTCKDCKLTKSEFDFGKGKGVCKSCVAIKTKETKEAKNEKNPSPTKDTENTNNTNAVNTTNTANINKSNMRIKKIQTDFEKMLNEIKSDTTKVNIEVLNFIGKLVLFASKFEDEEKK